MLLNTIGLFSIEYDFVFIVFLLGYLNKSQFRIKVLFIEYSEILFGPAHLLGKMKEYWLYMSENLPNGRKLLTNIRRAKTTKHYEDIVNKFFQN